MDKSSQSDPDLPGDWTFVPSEDDIMDASTPTPGVAGSRVEDISFNENTSNAKREMTLAKPTDKDEDEADVDAHGGSSRDSDIDIIDEEMDNSLHSMNSSALGQTSLMSFSELSVGTSSSFGNLEVSPSDLETAGSDASLPPGLELRPGVRRYRHVPNQRLNWSLTLLTVVVAAAAVGLGVGHYLGWSDRWFLQRKMLQPPTAMLEALHEELEACVQHQDPSLHYDGRDKRVCHEDEEYWADKLERLLLENTGLGHFLGKEASRISRCKASKVKCDKSDGPPLDLILNQIQFIMSVKFDQLGYLLLDQARTVARFKEWRENRRLLAERKGKEEADDLMANLEDKVKSLNEENEELRSRLGHDALREAMLISLERQVQMLQTENSQLKQKMQQAPSHERTPDITSASRMSTLRDKVNHLLIENEDLRGVVARLRYSRPLHTAEEVAVLLEKRRRADDDGFASQTLEADGGEPDESTRADDESEKTAEVDDGSEKTVLMHDDAFEKKKDEVEDAPTEEEPDFGLEEELSVLLDSLKRQQMDSKHWRKLYEQLRGSRVRDETGFVWKKLLGTAQTLYDHMETAFDTTLDSLFRFVRDSAESTADLTPRVQELVTRMREEVTKKRAEFQEYLEQSSRDETDGAGVSRTIKLLEGSLKKVFNVGAKFMSRGKKVTEAKVDKLFEKLSKVALALGKRWEKAATRGGTQKNGAPETAARNEPEEDGLGKRAMDLEEEEEEKEREDWFSSRAKGRERRRNDDGRVEAENWYLKRQRWRKEAQEATKMAAKPTKSRAEKKTRNSSRDHPLFTSDEEEIGYRSR